MKLFERRLANLEASVKAETGCRVAIVANDEDKEMSLQKVRDIHSRSSFKHENLICAVIHPSLVSSEKKYLYPKEEDPEIN